MPWWRGGLAGHATGGNTGSRLHAATAGAAQHSGEPVRRRHALHSPPAPPQRGWNAAAEAPARLQHWQMTQAYHAYHEGGMTLRMGLQLRFLAKRYIVQEAILLDLVQQWTVQNPRLPLGNATLHRSSKAWDAIAVAALGTELQGLFPTALCAMYSTIPVERKLAAGIASSHHSKDEPRRQYTKRDRARDRAVMAAWAAQRSRQQAAAQQRAQRRQQQEVDDLVRLGRARRTVAAAERALHILEQQVEAAAMDASLLLPAEQAAADARLALQAGRAHLEYLEEAVAAAERHKQQAQQHSGARAAAGAGWQSVRT